MTYKNLDFDADKPMQYKELRIKMASIYENQDQSLFGRVKAEALPEDFEDLDTKEKALAKAAVKDSKGQIRKSTKRIIEKVKEMRQNFSKAIIKGSMSGSGKLVFEFFGKFVEIWGGFPNVSKLKFGTSTRMLLGQENQCDGDFNNISSNSSADIDDSSQTDENSPLTECFEDFDENLDDDGDDYDPSVSDDVNNKPPFLKKNKLDNVPRLIDDKRKHLQKKTVLCSKGTESY